MATYVRNATGMLYRKLDLVGATFTVTPENKKYFEQGMVLLVGYGERTKTILTPTELEEQFTLLTEDDEDD